MSILAEDGTEIASMTAAQADDPAFATIANQLEMLLSGRARVVVMYRDGLLEEVRADLPCEVLLVEEDRYEQPPIALRRRPIAGDTAGVDKAVNLVEAQIKSLKP